MEKRNKYLIIIIVILVIVMGIAGFFAYQNYRMSQTDKLMLQHHTLAANYNAKADTTNTIFNTTPIDYTTFYNNINDLVLLNNETTAVDESAYQSADGSYKLLIALQLQEDTLENNAVNLWRSKNVYLQKNDYYNANEIIKQEESNDNEITKNTNAISTFLATHPDVKAYVNQHWNYTDQPA